MGFLLYLLSVLIFINKNQLNLQGIESIQHISLFNNLGQKILDINHENLTETTMDLGHLKSGVYFLHLFDAHSSSIHKILKE